METLCREETTDRAIDFAMTLDHLARPGPGRGRRRVVPAGDQPAVDDGPPGCSSSRGFLGRVPTVERRPRASRGDQGRGRRDRRWTGEPRHLAATSSHLGQIADSTVTARSAGRATRKRSRSGQSSAIRLASSTASRASSTWRSTRATSRWPRHCSRTPIPSSDARAPSAGRRASSAPGCRSGWPSPPPPGRHGRSPDADRRGLGPPTGSPWPT